MKNVEINVPASLLGYKYTRRLKRKFPASLNELNRDQLTQFCQAVKKSANIYEAKIRVLVSICKLPVMLIKALDIAQIAQLTLMLNGLFEANDMTKNKLPVIKFSRWFKSYRWLGPADELANLSMKEFIVADTYFMAYMDSPSRELLDYLVATLYRPQDKNKSPYRKDFDGDMREPFNEHLLEQRAKLVRSMSDLDKEAVLYFYIGCRNHIAKGYENIFDGGQSEGQSGGDWLDMLRTLPSEKFGTISQAEKENVHAVLTVVDRMMKDNKSKKFR